MILLVPIILSTKHQWSIDDPIPCTQIEPTKRILSKRAREPRVEGFRLTSPAAARTEDRLGVGGHGGPRERPCCGRPPRGSGPRPVGGRPGRDARAVACGELLCCRLQVFVLLGLCFGRSVAAAIADWSRAAAEVTARPRARNGKGHGKRRLLLVG